jgi:hypothetical protein
MNVKKIQPSNKQHDSWRRLYIRLLTEEMKAWDDLTPEERVLELGVIEDLIDAGYMSGKVNKDASGTPKSASIRGPTLAGRIFAEEQQDILDKKSLWGHIKSGAGLLTGWLAGIISALIIWLLTRIYNH